MDKIITGVAMGSIITLIIKEVINLYNKKIDFDRDLTRHIYHKKIDAAEKAIAFYSVYFQIISELKNSYQIIKNCIENDKEHLLETISEIIDINVKHYNALFENGLKEKSIINLYFDLDNLEYSDNDTEELYTNIAEVRGIDLQILDLYNSSVECEERGDTKLAKKKLKEAENKMTSYLESVEKLIKSYNKNKDAIDLLIERLKKEIKEKKGF